MAVSDSQSAFAEGIGVSPQKLSNYVNGRNKPGLDFISKTIDKYSNLNVRWLLLGEGPIWREDAPGTLQAGEPPAEYETSKSRQQGEIERLRAQVEVLQQTLLKIDRDRAARRVGEETGFTATGTEPEPAAG